MTVHKFVEANTFQSLPVSNIAGQSPHGYLLNGKFIYKIVDFPVPCFSTRVSESLFVKKKNPVKGGIIESRHTRKKFGMDPPKRLLKKGVPTWFGHFGHWEIVGL